VAHDGPPYTEDGTNPDKWFLKPQQRQNAPRTSQGLPMNLSGTQTRLMSQIMKVLAGAASIALTIAATLF